MFSNTNTITTRYDCVDVFVLFPENLNRSRAGPSPETVGLRDEVSQIYAGNVRHGGRHSLRPPSRDQS